MFLGSFLIPFFPHLFRQIYMILLIAVSAFSLTTGFGTHLVLNSMGIDFIIFHSDNLSFPFAVVFHIAAFLTVIYGIHNRDWRENVAITSYAGAAIAALHAGDLFTLFVWWEATALTSVFLILGGKSIRAYKSAIRYLIIQVGSGMLLLSGAIILFYSNEEALFQNFICYSKRHQKGINLQKNFFLKDVNLLD